MAYDRSMPVDSANRPQFYVSTECENVIHSLGEYTTEAGLRDPNKDPIDCLRYGAITGIYHMDEQSLLRQHHQNGSVVSYGAPKRRI